jgi:hypothetical protein
MKVELVQGCVCDSFEVDGKSVTDFSTQEVKDLLKKQIELTQGDAFCQGVFVPFGITVDDEVSAKRTGGFGSTSK